MSKSEILRRTDAATDFIWDWIKFSNSIPGGRAGETAVTSYLLTSLFYPNITNSQIKASKITDASGQPVQEKDSGADFLIIIVDRNQRKTRIKEKALFQAKILKKDPENNTNYVADDLMYKSFNHMVRGVKLQLYVFMNFCRENRLKGNTYEPYYIFYNSDFDLPIQMNIRPSLYSIPQKIELLGAVTVPLKDMFRLYFQLQLNPRKYNRKTPNFGEILSIHSSETLYRFFDLKL